MSDESQDDASASHRGAALLSAVIPKFSPHTTAGVPYPVVAAEAIPRANAESSDMDAAYMTLL